MAQRARKLLSTLVLCSAVLGIADAGCSGSKKDHGNGGNQAGQSGGSAAGSGAGAGSGGNAGTNVATGGSGGSGNAGNGGSSGSKADNDAGQDAGQDAGPALLKCGAPMPAASAGNTCPASDPVTLQATEIGSGGFNCPVLVTHSPNDPDKRLFVVERGGSIKVIKNGTALGTSFIDVAGVVASTGTGERGLLGMAFDPNYETTGRFWVDYSGMPATEGNRSIVESYEVSSNPDVADETTKKPLLDFPDLQSNHNGGMLAFGPDNCLYVSTGDGGNGDDVGDGHPAEGNGQNLETELGKILRVDASDASKKPKGNLAGTSVPWLWDYGMRNPWRFSFDRKSGDMYIGDVGQGRWEEIDVEPRGRGNKNYGWKVMEGKHCRGDTKGTALGAQCASQNVSDFVQPVYDYYHENGDNAVIGGYVYRGTNIPSLEGWYVFGDHGGHHIWAFVWNGTGTCKAPIDLTSQLTLTGSVTGFGEDMDGELYIATADDATGVGHIYRIDQK